MLRIQSMLTLFICVVLCQLALAQNKITGKIIDAGTKEPVAGASLKCADAACGCGCTTNQSGAFEMNCLDCKTILVSHLGYTTQQFATGSSNYTIRLVQANTFMQEVVVSAARGESVKRSQAPIAITALGIKTLQETKATSIDQVLNKVSGVNVISLGNEQHQMSIRQPMTTKGLFLYLEDGVPLRTTGLFNHNALLELNMAAAKSIEVIKGPSSSLYGSEAIGGVVNVITMSPAAEPLLKISAQANNIGYSRTDLLSSVNSGKWGFVASGYFAKKTHGFIDYSDFTKGAATLRADYKFSDKTSLINSLSWVAYYSDMGSGIDSAMFANREFTNPQTFTYRKVHALRYRSSLAHQWNANSKSTASLVFRNNSIEQNPAYRIKDDYKKVNGVFRGNKQVAHGELNESSFQSFMFIAQHKQNLTWKNAVFIGGVSADVSPSAYTARYIQITKDTLTKKYVNYKNTDSALTHYKTHINNYAVFMNFELSPLQKLRVVASLRYDLFHYNYINNLQPSAYSGAPSAVHNFQHISPKVGATYNFSARSGIYANYSQGFVPPQVTEMFTGVQVPNLVPSVFNNYEVGGWQELIRNHLWADFSLYALNGTNEIISVKMDDGSYANANAGKTLHKGIEAGINARLLQQLSFRFSGAYSRHTFKAYEEKGINLNGCEMNNAPHLVYNTELWFRPSVIPGLRIGAEVQHVGPYFADAANTAKYKGYCVLNLRTGYQKNGFEVWLNILNATNSYYATIVTKSNYGYSYQLGEPVNVNLGISYNFAQFFKSK